MEISLEIIVSKRMIRDQRLGACGKTGVYQFSIRHWKDLCYLNKDSSPIQTNDFKVSNHTWSIKLWLCPLHLHFELVKKTKSTYLAKYTLIILSHVASKLQCLYFFKILIL